MNYSDRKLLERWARLQLQVAIARTAREGHKLEHNVGRVARVDSENLFRSDGFRALRKWWGGLSDMAKRNARKWMSKQLEGVEKLRKAIEAEGGEFDHADLEFNIKTRTDTGELVEPPMFKGLPFGDDAGGVTTTQERGNEQRTDHDAQQPQPEHRAGDDDEAQA